MQHIGQKVNNTPKYAALLVTEILNVRKVFIVEALFSSIYL